MANEMVTKEKRHHNSIGTTVPSIEFESSFAHFPFLNIHSSTTLDRIDMQRCHFNVVLVPVVRENFPQYEIRE